MRKGDGVPADHRSGGAPKRDLRIGKKPEVEAHVMLRGDAPTKPPVPNCSPAATSAGA